MKSFLTFVHASVSLLLIVVLRRMSFHLLVLGNQKSSVHVHLKTAFIRES